MIILYIIAFHYTVMYSFIAHTLLHIALCCCFVFSNKVILCVLYLTD